MVVYIGCRRCWVRLAASGLCCAYLNLVVDAVIAPSLVTITINHRAADMVADLGGLEDVNSNKRARPTRMRQRCTGSFEALMMTFSTTTVGEDHPTCRSSIVEWFSIGLTIGGSANGGRQWWKSLAELILARTWPPLFRRQMKLDAVGRDLGLYPDTRLNDWRFWLVMLWLRSIRQRLERW